MEKIFFNHSKVGVCELLDDVRQEYRNDKTNFVCNASGDKLHLCNLAESAEEILSLIMEHPSCSAELRGIRKGIGKFEGKRFLVFLIGDASEYAEDAFEMTCYLETK